MPVRFRRVMEGDGTAGEEVAPLSVVLVPWEFACIRVYPLPQWARLQERFEEMLDAEDALGLDAVASSLRRLMYGNTHDVTLDAHGRVLVPMDLREEAGLEREVIWMGLGSFMEVWSPDRLKRQMSPDAMQEVQQRFGGRRQPGGG